MKYFSLLSLVAVIAIGAYVYMQYGGSFMTAQTEQTTEQQSQKSAIELAQETVAKVEQNAEDALEQATDAESEPVEQSLPENNQTQETMKKDDAMTANSTALAPANTPSATMMVAGGCFWCVEADLEKLSGVIEAVSGYAEGSNENPTYENYAKNGHREVVEVTYNPSVVSFEEILIYAMKHMDPTDGDGSFHDRGEYYAPAFYYDTAEQKAVIENLIKEVDEKGPYDKPLAIAVLQRPTFWEAEDYHQNYYKGTLSQLKYKYYRNASGRDDFIKKYWGDDTDASLYWREEASTNSDAPWLSFTKPSDAELQSMLTDIQYKVTQKNGTEPSFNNTYWDNHEEGIYVDIISGEPLFSSTHKFDSGTGWPSFTRPIDYNMVTEHDDFLLLQKRTEIRSAIADSHLGHVFNDAPKELGGMRYCMNSASLRFVAKADMEEEGYGDYLYLFN